MPAGIDELPVTPGTRSSADAELAPATDAGDKQLMLRVSRGDVPAFEALFERYQSRVFAFLYRLTWHRQRAEDLLQETFLRLWRAGSRYHPSGKFATYLFQIARNLWRNESQKEKRREHPSLDSPLTDSTGLLSDVLTTGLETPDEALLRREIVARVRGALADLPEAQREAFVLSHYAGLTFREIAEVTETPLGTVKTRMMLAERKLRDSLEGLSPLGM